MKIRHGIIIFILLTIGLTIFGDDYLPINFELNRLLTSITLILWIASIGLIIYLIVRNVFRAIKGAVTRVPQDRDYRSEAQRACEKVTPKQKQYTTPPWEG